MLALVLSGLLLLIAAILGNARQSQEAHRTVSHVVQPPQVVMVKDDILPPVMQRIAQCEVCAVAKFRRVLEPRELTGALHPARRQYA